MELWELAMESAFPDVRSKALEMLNEMGMESMDLVLKALNDASEDVRLDAFLIADEYEEGSLQQQAILDAALDSDYVDIRIEAVDMLKMGADKASVQKIFDTLPNAVDDEYVEVALEALGFMLDTAFESRKEAIQWWEENESNYDDELLLVQE
jgi:HEAT repeat protein